MKKVLAVALLDCRRLGFGLASAALIAGLVPSLSSGLGAKVLPDEILAIVFLLVGLAAGGTFGSDFSEGRSSFFFARPLSTGALIAGRFVALLALAAGAFSSFMVSYWLSSRGREDFTFWIVDRTQAEVLANCWAVALLFSLAAASRGRRTTPAGGLRSAVLIPVRLFFSFGAFILVFGLFADLILRAYAHDKTPFKVFIESWVVAGFLASCVGMAAGRTESLRISRFQGRVMLGHFVLVTIVVIAAYTWVLHPGPEAIRRVEQPSWGSPEGRSAYVRAEVDRGDGRTFQPVFILDVASGQARRLNADPFHGPWTSRNGATLVWSEATPIFFRPLWRYVGGATTFRVRSSSGEVSVLPMPRNIPDYTRARDLADFGGTVDQVLPSPEGDVFAIAWDDHLTFTARGRGELSDVKLGSGRPSLRAMSFLPSGELRAVISRQSASGRTVEIADVDPKSGAMKVLTSAKVEGGSRVQLDATASRVLLTTIAFGNRGATLALIDLKTGGDPRLTILLKDCLFPRGLFLSDGRIAAAGQGWLGSWEKRTFRIFSPSGEMILDIPTSDGSALALGTEMFPGILAATTSSYSSDLSLIEAASGAVIRSLPGFFPLQSSFHDPAPPGTPAARLLVSRDRQSLYELPSITAEPRLLLPGARP